MLRNPRLWLNGYSVPSFDCQSDFKAKLALECKKGSKVSMVDFLQKSFRKQFQSHLINKKIADIWYLV